MRKRISARRMGTSAAKRFASIIFAWICRTRMAVSSKAYPAETAEAFCDGYVAPFAFFGGGPQSILYDNTKLAVAKIVKGGRRLRSKMFAELQSHYLFDDRFERPGKEHAQGQAEALLGDVRPTV